MLFFVFRVLILFLVPFFAYSDSKVNFVNTNSNNVNMYYGPGDKFPIKFIYVVKNVPFISLRSYEQWREVEDIDGAVGWVKSDLLNGNRYVYIHPDEDVAYAYNQPNYSAKILLKIDKGVLLHLVKCEKDWCMITKNKNSAWINKRDIWGVDSQKEGRF